MFWLIRNTQAGLSVYVVHSGDQSHAQTGIERPGGNLLFEQAVLTILEKVVRRVGCFSCLCRPGGKLKARGDGDCYAAPIPLRHCLPSSFGRPLSRAGMSQSLKFAIALSPRLRPQFSLATITTRQNS